jgi:hypothetical protein
MARNRGRRKAHQPTSAQPPKSRAQGRRPAPDKFASLIQTAFTYHQAGVQVVLNDSVYEVRYQL